MPIQDDALTALDEFKIELPSWGFADTGTRFGKFHQKAAARTTAHKFHDAGLVHKLTGACPTVAVHVLWDFDVSQATETAGAETKKLAESHGIAVGSINPNIFQDQQYKLGSFCSPDAAARKSAVDHTLYSVELMKHTGSDLLSMWLADGTNYPGQDNIVARKRRLEDGLKTVHDALPSDGTMLVEYKPFEPAFYHTDIADWGMAAAFSRKAGKQAKVLVDTGHHLPGCNIEHIVSFLLDDDMLGGFHFNDRKYADDDLTLGSIDPYAVFRIFSEIAQFAADRNAEPAIAYMVDQSHNLKPKLEAMVQTVDQAQKLYLKARLVDRKKLADAQAKGDITAAEECLRDAYEKDVRPMLAEWRKGNGLPENPLAELRTSGVIDRLAADRDTGEEVVSSYA
ncbi:MAG: TIM barrel protein [Planctomycetota bacterium]